MRCRSVLFAGAVATLSPVVASVFVAVALAGTAIDCDTTPFGRTNNVIGDSEFLSLYTDGSHASGGFSEYRLPFGGESTRLVRVHASDLFPSAYLPPASSDSGFLAATSADLDGDGREEVAVAYGLWGGLGRIRIVVFERQPGFTPSAQPIDSWTLDLDAEGTGMATESVELEAGDFAGSETRRQQLALTWRSLGGPDSGRLNTIVLNGSDEGGILDADNAWSGRWQSDVTYSGSARTSVAHGDFLLDGRDQIAVVASDSGILRYHLLEYNAPGMHANSGMPVAAGDNAVGSRRFDNPLNPFVDDAFDPDAMESNFCYPGVCGERVDVLQAPARIVASGGDLVDSAAAELVVHVSFQGMATLVAADGGSVLGQTPTGGYFLGQRLLHFDAVRAGAGGDVSVVSLVDTGSGRPFDSSRIIGARNPVNALPIPETTDSDFDAAIGALDGTEKGRIALARVVDDQLAVQVYAALVRLNAAFRYTVHGATGPFPVDFDNNASGDIASVHWDFGDGASSVAQDPSHEYNATGTYTVTLRVTGRDGKQSSHVTSVVIDGEPGAGGTDASYTYRFGDSPLYSAATQDQHLTPTPGVSETIINNFDDGSRPRIAIADMNRDGYADIMTTAQSVVIDETTNSIPPSAREYRATIWHSLWRLDVPSAPTSFVATHEQQVTASSPIGIFSLPYVDAEMLASDFDGDAVFATLGTDCRAVAEPQLRNLVWMPPYFQALQSAALDNGYTSASFGIDRRAGHGTENRSGSFTGHSVSAYLGVSAGTTDKEPVNFRATLKATAGHDWQSEHGAIHGDDVEYSYSEGQAANIGEALVVAESDSANCYNYDVVRSSGVVPNSSMRMCQITGQERSAQTADIWNAQYDYAQATPNWTPVQRDWASMALFRPATSAFPFTGGKGADKATDGLFSTAATGVDTVEPYLDIDLGQLRDIQSIRVFPAANTDANGQLLAPLGFDRAAIDLLGFRVYVSAAPFEGPGVPSGPGVREFAPPTDNGMVFDRWNILTLDDDYNPLPGRYIRLQHPGATQARVNVSEIEVFGPTHSDPPAFPDAVCQPTADTGYFLARVWDPMARAYRNIEERGDLMWSGTNATQQPTGVLLDNGQPCINHTDVRETTVWKNLRIGNTGITHSWDSTSDVTHTVGSYGSIESATRVGAEMEAELGNTYVYAVAGVSYEYTFGITSETQSTSFWGNGLQIGGSVGGFDQAYQSLVATCGYFPHPYAYQLTERGSVNYRHDLYVVDYTVQQPANGSAWQRGAVPAACYGLEEYDDVIFADGFEE